MLLVNLTKNSRRKLTLQNQKLLILLIRQMSLKLVMLIEKIWLKNLIIMLLEKIMLCYKNMLKKQIVLKNLEQVFCDHRSQSDRTTPAPFPGSPGDL